MYSDAKGAVLKKNVGLILRRLELQPRTTDMLGGSSLQERKGLCILFARKEECLEEHTII
jgi:hypothetical protein